MALGHPQAGCRQTRCTESGQRNSGRRDRQLKPDLIVAVNAGLDADTYQKLTAMPPPSRRPSADAFFEPWKDQATAVATAVFKADAMRQLINRRRQPIRRHRQEHPSFKDKKAALLAGSISAGTVTATLPAGAPTS